MKVQSKREIEVVLTLNETEAKWLVGLMQNPLVSQNMPAQESATNAEMRRQYFEALNSGLTMGLG